LGPFYFIMMRKFMDYIRQKVPGMNAAPASCLLWRAMKARKYFMLSASGTLPLPWLPYPDLNADQVHHWAGRYMERIWRGGEGGRDSLIAKFSPEMWMRRRCSKNQVWTSNVLALCRILKCKMLAFAKWATCKMLNYSMNTYPVFLSFGICL
jgi:hypothetical protein